MKALRRQQVEEIYVKILEDIYFESIATRKIHMVSGKIPMQKGVRQGNSISPKLVTLEEVFKNLELEKSGIEIHGEYFNSLRFANDIVLMSESTY